MAITGNKGEWSEIYTLFKLLSDGKVYAGDADLNKLDLYYPIINILREESRHFEYKPNTEQRVVVVDCDGEEFARFSMDRFVKASKDLLAEITSQSTAAFSVPDAECFMHAIGCERLKAPSRDKADIQIVIHDLRTGMKPRLGFSIKSQLGHPSTLLNAGRPTNFIYRVKGHALTDTEIAEINAINGHLPRMKAITDKGCVLEYADMENEQFRNNLLFLDTCMPRFVADCLLVDSLPDGASTIAEAVERVAAKNPFGFTGKSIATFYEHRMKRLLLASALGMTPTREWTGRYDANGGYLVVRTDGEIVCYHFYNVNDVEDYLYRNTRFERASRSRYQWGSLYRGEDGAVRLKLNLQIRFKQ